MRKVYLHGALAEKYGSEFSLDVATAGEAVRALGTNYPEFLKDVRDGAWHVIRGDLETGLDLDADQCRSFKLGRAPLHIVPFVAGSKRAGLLKVVLGVALVGVGLFMGFATPILAAGSTGSMLIGGATYGNLAMIGAAMALAGVSQLLAPEEKSGDDKDSSFTFSGPGNTYEQGAPVPLIYGEVITGSVMISGGVDIEKIRVGA